MPIDRLKKRACTPLVVLALILISQSPAMAIWGTTDKVPAATLLVPFVEVGVNVAVNPHDTLPVVFNGGVGQAIIHWEIWNIDGEQTIALAGNETIPEGGSWSGSVRNLINLFATDQDRQLLLDGPDFYRGFMTIDLVSAPTFETPFGDSYPFAFDNRLSGMIYYARFLEGSSNALSMVPIEAIDQDGELINYALFDGFYDDSNGFREEIDANARSCAAALPKDILCSELRLDGDIESIHARVARRDADETDTRMIVFAWNSKRPNQGGPSPICAELGCAQSYPFLRNTQDGSIATNGQVRLDHVVNIIRPPEALSDPFGDFRIFEIADPNESTQIYAFVMQSAKPPEFPGLNWDAIFEAAIDP